MKHLVILAAALSLGACANSSLTVEAPNRSGYKTDSATVQRDPEMIVTVESEDLAYTQRELEEALFGGDNPVFRRGNGLTVRYRYVGYDEGSRFGRYLTGGLAGGSNIVLEVDFIGPDGAVLSTVRGEGSVRGGFVGGSSKSGVDKAVKKIAAYAGAQFR